MKFLLAFTLVVIAMVVFAADEAEEPERQTVYQRLIPADVLRGKSLSFLSIYSLSNVNNWINLRCIFNIISYSSFFFVHFRKNLINMPRVIFFVVSHALQSHSSPLGAPESAQTNDVRYAREIRPI